MTRRRGGLLVAGACALMLALTQGCASDRRPEASRSEPGRSTTSVSAIEEVGGVPLAEPATSLGRQCQEAATSLGFAVPCPTRLPLVDGERVGCSDSCVAAVGEQADVRIFALDVSGYDALAGSPETVRHLTVDAFKLAEGPPSPCYEGVPAGTLHAGGVELVLVDCPPSSVASQVSNRLGEGVYAEHLLGYWDANEVRYIVSVHRGSDGGRDLLERLASSIKLVEP